jgi:hypothetical protein
MKGANKRIGPIVGIVLLGVFVALVFTLLPARNPITLAARDLRQTVQWPRVELSLDRSMIRVVDQKPWANVLLYLDGKLIDQGATWSKNPTNETWSWEWTLPKDPRGRARFFHSCDAGCEAWTQFDVSPDDARPKNTLRPTKLGVVFASQDRDWHDRSAWNVELVYASSEARDDYWHVNQVAERVMLSKKRSLKTLLRIDYDRGQAVPPTDDYEAFDRYLRFVENISRDARFEGLYGIVIGSGVNDKNANGKSPNRPVTPEWYARMINGYGIDVNATDNIVDRVRMANDELRILVGPIRPWNTDQNGARKWQIDVPWLNYMNTLVALLDKSAIASALAGLPYASPDGFALQVPGRPDLSLMGSIDPALEPRTTLKHAEWGDAQAGFRIYRDWMAIVNAHESTRGLPLYVTSMNTFAPGLAPTPDPPAKNYPRGWLRTALEEINREPQIHALCWFVDGIPGDDRWDLYSLQKRTGRLSDAADEFDALLK